MSRLDASRRTIEDFGEQWTAYPANTGYYASGDHLRDLFAGLLDPGDVRDARVAEIGSGTGRLVRVLLEFGVAEITALEPSDAFNILQKSYASNPAVTCVRATGDLLPAHAFDYVFAIGVIHHIPEPDPVLRAAYNALRAGGRIAVWLYGREGNRGYLALASCLRAFTTRIPHALLVALCWILWVPAYIYMLGCRVVPLPMRGYLTRVWCRLTPRQKHLAIYDQLNPAYAKYYMHDEASALLERAGFQDIKLDHRHGYSWAVVGTKP